MNTIGNNKHPQYFNAETSISNILRPLEDGRLVAAASFDGQAKLWDAERGVLRSALTGHGDAVMHAAFTRRPEDGS